jgi:hypothetical protein
VPKVEWNWKDQLTLNEQIALEALCDALNGLEVQVDRLREAQKAIINNARVKAKTKKDKVRQFKIQL